jgi:hypothetical protein
MKITRLLKNALIGIVIVLGASSCCWIKRGLAEHDIGPDHGWFNRSGVNVTLILRNITTSYFIKWNVVSDQMCTQSSGEIKPGTDAFEQTWDVGSPHHVRFYWDTLYGEADATVLVNNVVAFDGHCVHLARGKVKMIETCNYPRVYKTFGSGPYLQERLGRNETDVVFATSTLPPRFGVWGD